MKNKNNDFEKALSENERMELWFNKNWQKCIAGLVIVLIVAVAAYSVYYISGHNARAAAEKLSAAKPEEVANILKNDSDVAGAGVARLRLAQSMVEKKDFTNAANVFKLVASDESIPSSLRERAKISEASCKELAGNVREAAQTYINIGNDASVSAAVRAEANFNAGRIFAELKDSAKAKEILAPLAGSKAVNEFDPADQWYRQADALLKTIK